MYNIIMEDKRILKGPFIKKDLLVKFLILKHLEQSKIEISRIKLQKSLYFLFAIWSGFSYNEDNESKENELEECYVNTYLYNDAKFEAWKYGPVDKDVYNSHLNNLIFSKTDNKELDKIEEELFKNDKSGQTKKFIKNLVKDIFMMSEFDLVERSHLDDVWINSFKNENKEMKLEDIQKEYIEKLKH